MARYGVVVWYTPKQHRDLVGIVEWYEYRIVDDFEKIYDAIKDILVKKRDKIAAVGEVRIFNLDHHLEDFCKEIDPELEPLCEGIEIEEEL